ncbi:MAG: hypothetical protein AAFZ10_01555 [Pseudomonadota bacterium]
MWTPSSQNRDRPCQTIFSTSQPPSFADKSLSPLELLDAQIARAEATAETVNAFTYPYLTLAPAEKLVADFGVPDELWKPVRATPPDTEGLLL